MFGHAAAAEAAPPLDTDATGPLFSLGDLAPGASSTSCVSVSANDAVEGPLRLHAATSGVLARYLHLTVETGTGGRYGDCGGFSGTSVYAGTLADFARDHAGSGSALTVDAPGGATFRFNVTLLDDPAAQGTAAAATFTWSALTDDGNTISTPVTVDDDPSPGTAAPPTDDGQQRKATKPDREAVSPPARERLEPRHERAAPVADAPRTLFENVSRFLGAAAQRAAFPLVALLVVLGFVVFQHQIDRKDPKLALAPVYAEPDLPFVHPATLQEVTA